MVLNVHKIFTKIYQSSTEGQLLNTILFLFQKIHLSNEEYACHIQLEEMSVQKLFVTIIHHVAMYVGLDAYKDFRNFHECST